MNPKLISGKNQSDTRGTLYFNNDFDASVIKRIYIIENIDVNFIRAWQGHKIEKRWFSAIRGSFKIELIKIDNWDNPSKDLERFVFILDDINLDILHVPHGYISSIQSIEEGSRLLVMADYLFNEIEDQYRFDTDYFNS